MTMAKLAATCKARLLCLASCWIASFLVGCSVSVDPTQTKIYDSNHYGSKMDNALLDVAHGEMAKAKGKGLHVESTGGRICVDILVARKDVDNLVSQLEGDLDFEKEASAGGLLSGSLPIQNLLHLEQYNEIRQVSYPFSFTSTFSVTSEAFKVMNVDIVQRLYGLTGAGVTIGVLADSFDCLGGANAGIASGDLPDNVIVVKDYFEDDCKDEGRAILELIHDLVADATLAFHTSKFGQAAYAEGIRQLGSFCDIVLDDVFYSSEAPFQPGVVAQAVSDLAADGVPYFMAQGNSFHNNVTSWESDNGFLGSGIFADANDQAEYHDFGFGTFLPISPSAEGNWFVLLTWDEPALSANGNFGSSSNLDLVVFGDQGNIVGMDMTENVGGDPVAFVSGQWFAGLEAPDSIGITLLSGPPPQNVKLFFPSGVTIDVSFTSGFHSTSVGHHNGPDGAGVAATFWRDTPRKTGQDTATIEKFSSRGGTPFLFDESGNRLSSPLIVENPKFTAPDGASTSFFGTNNNFFGTSGAVPHAAAVAALLLELDRDLTVNQIYSVISDSAIDMDDPCETDSFDVGYDFVTGAGFIDAQAAVESIFPGPIRTSGGGCFSASVTLVVEDRGPTALQDIKLGDKVMVRHDRFEPVYSFGHYDPSSIGSFVKITAGTSPQQKPLHVSRNHMLSVVGKNMVPASLVEVGDFIMSGEGRAVPVLSKVYDQLDRGIYAPFTPSGTIVVNGIVASCYIAFQESSHIEVGSWLSPLSYHWMAHAYTFPHRFYCQYVSRCESGKYRDDGLSSWVGGGYEVGSWLLEDTNVVYLGLTLCVTAPIGIVFSLLDSIPCELSNAVFTLAIAFGLMVTSEFLSRRVK